MDEARIPFKIAIFIEVSNIQKSFLAKLDSKAHQINETRR